MKRHQFENKKLINSQMSQLLGTDFSTGSFLQVKTCLKFIKMKKKANKNKNLYLQPQGLHREVLLWMTYLGCSLSLAAEILCLVAFILLT